MYESKRMDDFQEYSQLLLASKIFNEYLETKATVAAARNLEIARGRTKSYFPANVCPETYCDSWIAERVKGVEEDWKEGVFQYFIQLVVNYPNVFKEPEEGMYNE